MDLETVGRFSIIVDVLLTFFFCKKKNITIKNIIYTLCSLLLSFEAFAGNFWGQFFPRFTDQSIGEKWGEPRFFTIFLREFNFDFCNCELANCDVVDVLLRGRVIKV